MQTNVPGPCSLASGRAYGKLREVESIFTRAKGALGVISLWRALSVWTKKEDLYLLVLVMAQLKVGLFVYMADILETLSRGVAALMCMQAPAIWPPMGKAVTSLLLEGPEDRLNQLVVTFQLLEGLEVATVRIMSEETSFSKAVKVAGAAT